MDAVASFHLGSDLHLSQCSAAGEFALLSRSTWCLSDSLQVAVVWASTQRRYVEATLFCGILLSSTVFNVWLNRNLQTLLGSLSEPVPTSVHVLRHGVEFDIPFREVVPGDIIHLKQVCSAYPVHLELLFRN